MGQVSGHMGELSARRRRWRHLEIQVDIQTKQVYLDFKCIWTPGKGYLDFDTHINMMFLLET